MKNKKLSYKRTPFILQNIAIFFLKPIFKFFLRLKIRGLENLKKIDRGVIFAPNHLSYFDPAIIPISLPWLSKHLPMFYVSRPHSSYVIHEPGQVIFTSFLSESWGSFEYIPGQKDYEASLKNHATILNDRGSVCIFAEGGISQDGQIYPENAKGGLGYLAYKTQKLVIPVKIEGVYNMTFKDFFLRKRKVIVTFGKPVYFDTNDLSLVNPNKFKEFSGQILISIKNS